MPLFKHSHEDLPQLPEDVPVDRYGQRGLTCPGTLSDGSVCGEDLAYAHSVREYHSVRSWSATGLVLREANEFDAAEDEDPHLWCANGHDWAVPEMVELD